jgi:hypothetical protein
MFHSLQCQRVSKTNQQEIKSMEQAVFACSLLGLLFNPEDGGSMFLKNSGRLLMATWCHVPEDITLLCGYILVALTELWRSETKGLALTILKE